MSPKKYKRSAPSHPWAQLLDLELKEPTPSVPKKRGRPPGRIPRKERMTICLTANEKKALNRLAENIEKNLGKGVSRSSLLGFMIFQMEDLLTNDKGEMIPLPEKVNSFSNLASFLDSLPE